LDSKLNFTDKHIAIIFGKANSAALLMHNLLYTIVILKYEAKLIYLTYCILKYALTVWAHTLIITVTLKT